MHPLWAELIQLLARSFRIPLNFEGDSFQDVDEIPGMCYKISKPWNKNKSNRRHQEKKKKRVRKYRNISALLH